jgi:hypothetical protein
MPPLQLALLHSPYSHTPPSSALNSHPLLEGGLLERALLAHGHTHTIYSYAALILIHCNHVIYSYTALILVHYTHTIYSYTALILIHYTHTIYSYTALILIHCTHTIYSYTALILIHCTHAIYSYTALILIHYTHTIYSYTALILIHCTYTIYSYTVHIHYTHTLWTYIKVGYWKGPYWLMGMLFPPALWASLYVYKKRQAGFETVQTGFMPISGTAAGNSALPPFLPFSLPPAPSPSLPPPSSSYSSPHLSPTTSYSPPTDPSFGWLYWNWHRFLPAYAEPTTDSANRWSPDWTGGAPQMQGGAASL